MKFNFSAVSKHLLTSARITLNERRGPAPARPMRDGGGEGERRAARRGK